MERVRGEMEFKQEERGTEKKRKRERITEAITSERMKLCANTTTLHREERESEREGEKRTL